MIIRASENQLEIATPAKVNLFLELLSDREDGFHELETVMSSVSIYDRMRFIPRKDSELRLSLSHTTPGRVAAEDEAIPTDHRNLIQKALHLVRSMAQAELDESCCTQGMDVHLEKTIPSAAGLGGASSNAAATLVAANRIWKLNWSRSRLATIAARLGSDIAFFLYGGTAVCRGRGEKIQPLLVPAGLSVVVAKPSDSLSTARVFGEVSIDDNPRDSAELVQSVRAGKPATIGNRMFNRLQQFAEPLTHQIVQLRYEFSRLNCWGHQMSGSGSSYFGVFSNCCVARQAAQSLSSRVRDVRIFCSETLSPHQSKIFSPTG